MKYHHEESKIQYSVIVLSL